MNREIIDFLKMNDVEYKKDALLSELSPIRIGAETELLVYPKDDEQLIGLVQLLEKSKIKYKILGRMSNVLLPDEKYEGVIIRTDRMAAFIIHDGILEAMGGASLPSLALRLRDEGLSGLEGISGIPGSIAGAICGNAGAFGREISELILSVKAYDPRANLIVYMSNKECDFSYRTSLFKREPLVIISARLLLARADPSAIDREMKRCRDIRRSTQPTDKPSLGSTFRRPGSDASAARLIDDCGLKGYRIGGAEISKKHAGFIINSGGATAADYIELSDFAAKCVYEKYKIKLEREIEII